MPATAYQISIELDEPEGGLQQASLSPAKAAEALAEKSEAALQAEAAADRAVHE